MARVAPEKQFPDCLPGKTIQEQLQEVVNMGRPVIDLTGKRFGRLIVIGICNDRKFNSATWLCKCDCGNTKIVASNHLKRGSTTSCGCYRDELNKQVKHGETNTVLYSKWRSMKSRCNNPNDQAFKDYGARGINVCEEWNNDFLRFKTWMLDNGYEEGLTIERKDFNGDYTPENCELIPLEEQTKNTRRNVFITYKNETLILKDWSKKIGINYRTLLSRYRQGDRGDFLFRPLDRKRAK